MKSTGSKSGGWSGEKYTQLAREEGYEARSVYKLKEIDQKLHIVPRSGAVLDLGCAPGSWSRYAREKGGAGLRIVGVDLAPVPGYVGECVVGSIYDLSAESLRESLGGPARLVMSDMAPLTMGNRSADHLRQVALAEQALVVATGVLAPGGAFVAKVFDGSDAHAFVMSLRPWFGEVKRFRPDAVRQTSREFFVVGQGFKPAARQPPAP